MTNGSHNSRKKENTDNKKIEKKTQEKDEKKRSEESPAVQISGEPKRRSKEKESLQIDERAALKEMSKLYRDLLERFEELKQKQDAQMASEPDSTRLRREAGSDPSVSKMLQELTDNVKQAACNFKKLAMLVGSSMPNAELHQRELDNIVLELECVAGVK